MEQVPEILRIIFLFSLQHEIYFEYQDNKLGKKLYLSFCM